MLWRENPVRDLDFGPRSEAGSGGNHGNRLGTGSDKDFPPSLSLAQPQLGREGIQAEKSGSGSHL